MHIQQGAMRPPRRLEPGEGGGNWMQKPQKIAARQSAGPVCPDLPEFRDKLEIWIFFNGKSTFFFFPQMLALNDIYCKTLRGPNKTHLWAFQSIWASRFYTYRVYGTILHIFLLCFPARTLGSRELGSCPSLYYK